MADVAIINFNPPFSVDPAFCPSEVTGPVSDDKVPTTLCTDESCIKVPTLPDLTPVKDPNNPTGPPPPENYCVDYPVETSITVTDKDGTPMKETVTTTVRVCNPCLDADHITISPPASFEEIDYIIEQGALEFNAHGEFTINNAGNPHSLCGEFVYVPLYDDNDKPVAYDDGKTQVSYTDK
jgi:hypothetical protein